MICGLLQSPTAAWLQARHPVFGAALAWLRSMPAAPADGIIELDGPEFYVNVHGYATKPLEICRWESHRHTIDIQYCISGGEAIDWTQSGLAPMSDYDESKDAEHWRDTGGPRTRLGMVPGMFVLFLPNEPHRPKVFDGEHSEVRKLVFKIDVKRLGP
jgi:YhcH/YjgK/YiaL family protein